MPTKHTPKSGKKTRQARPWYRRAGTIKVFSVLLLVLFAWLIYLDAQVRYRFEGKRWAMPAQVFARALEIYEGRALNLGNLEHELGLLSYQKKASVDGSGSYAVTGKRIDIHARAHVLPEGAVPAKRFAFRLSGDVVSDLTATEGKTEGLYTVEPYRIGGIYPGQKEERELIAYQDLPPELVRALLVTEDRSFYEHWGLSPLSILRALWSNLTAGRVVQGGSTLTQQLVKNFYLSSERSLWRKGNEALMALMLESHYSKADILETYANEIYLGQAGATAIHGFAMASQFYFAKPLTQCEVQELALLVALVKGPSYYDPRRHPKRAKQRRDLVLSLMRDAGDISFRDYQLSSAQSLGLISKPRIQTNRYPAFLDLVKRQLRDDYRDEDLRTEGLKIYTTLDPQLQERLERASDRVIPGLSVRNEENLQLGAIFTGVGTGEVLAMLGDRNPRYQGFNRALDASRQIGSLIKPAVYLSALLQPQNYSLASQISDQPFKIRFENGDEWLPRNFDKQNEQEVSLYEGLARSLNVATARLGLEIGVDRVSDTLRVLGIRQPLNPYPSLLLGAQTLSPFEVSKFYQTIASNGFNMPLRAIREVQTHDGEVLSRYPFEIEQVVPAQAIFLLQYAMQEVMREGTGRSAYRRLPKALSLAGKTGTTNDNRDSWFAGFSGDYLGVVWVGRDDNGITDLTGSSGALRVWTDVMASVPQYPLAMVKPGDVKFEWFDEASGKRTDEQCKNARPLPVWGETTGIDYQRCASGFSSIKGWFKAWF